jgi:hypothetical protein
MMYGGKVQNALSDAQIPGSPGRSLRIAAAALGMRGIMSELLQFET